MSNAEEDYMREGFAFLYEFGVELAFLFVAVSVFVFFLRFLF